MGKRVLSWKIFFHCLWLSLFFTSTDLKSDSKKKKKNQLQALLTFIKAQIHLQHENKIKCEGGIHFIVLTKE